MALIASGKLPARLVAGAAALGLLVTAVVMVGGWVERARLASLRERGDARLELYAAVLEHELGRYHHLPAAVQLHPDVAMLLRHPQDAGNVERVDRFLEALNAEAGASELYLLDHAGEVLAASNWDEAVSFVGVDLAYRPYFQEAMRRGLGRFYGIGTTSGEPGYYFAKAILAGGRPLGVATVKVSLDKLQNPWRRSPGQLAMVVDGDGVVILASEPDWKYRTLAPLAPETLRRFQATRQFENVRLDPLDVRIERTLEDGAQIVSLPDGAGQGRHRMLLQERRLSASGWRTMLLSELEDLATLTRGAQAVTGLGLGSLMLLGLFLQQRRRARRLELAAKGALEHANLELERKVAERTRALVAAQNELVQASRLAALGQMAAGVTHELNQPLAALRTLTDNAVTLLQREQPAQVETNLAMISQIITRMGGITQQLKTFAWKPRTPAGPVPVGACLERAVGLVQARLQAQGVKLGQPRPEAEIQVLADAGRLEQVFVNLLTNALDALRDRGNGVIELAVEPCPGGRVVIVVRDNGPGIATEVMPRLFEPFFTTKDAGLGLGLGLTLSEGIVRSYGGSLTACSRPEGGAELKVELPALPPAAGGADG